MLGFHFTCDQMAWSRRERWSIVQVGLLTLARTPTHAVLQIVLVLKSYSVLLPTKTGSTRWQRHPNYAQEVVTIQVDTNILRPFQ